MFTPADEVKKLLHDLRAAALKRDIDAVEARSDEIVALMSAQLTPTLSDRWEKAMLTPREVLVADFLWERRGKIVQKQALYDALYANDIDGGPEPRIVDVWLCKIRNKLAGAKCGYHIETVWGRGYRMVEGDGEKVTVITGRGISHGWARRTAQAA